MPRSASPTGGLEPQPPTERLRSARIKSPTIMLWAGLAMLVVVVALLYSIFGHPVSDGKTQAGDSHPARFEQAPDPVLLTCRKAQARADFVVLCPTKLPRQERGAVGCRPPDGLRREVLEETGITISAPHLCGVYKNMTRGIVALIFRCESGNQELVPTDEAAKARWMTATEVENTMDPAYACRLLDALDVQAATPAIRTHDSVHLIDT